MIDRREQALTYVLLGVFSLIALVPIVGHPADRAAGAGQVANFGQPDGLHVAQLLEARGATGTSPQYLRSSAIVVGRRRARSRRCSRSWPATRSG